LHRHGGHARQCFLGHQTGVGGVGGVGGVVISSWSR
jgi:hypothetical protein